MKKILVIVSLLLTSNIFAAVPTEEGLLRNVANNIVEEPFVEIKFSINSLNYEQQPEFGKFIYEIDEEKKETSLLQIMYSSAEMKDGQILGIKYIPSIKSAIKYEKSMEKSLFNGILLMLSNNSDEGVRAYLNKTGVSVIDNNSIKNEDKVKLLKDYKAYLEANKGRTDVGSPLNPEDPKQREKNIEIFRQNTFKTPENIELVKKDDVFTWKVDWKATQAFFSNETKEFKSIEFNALEGALRIEASNYISLNKKNMMPKSLNIRGQDGKLSKVEMISQQNYKKFKNLKELYVELQNKVKHEDSKFEFIF